MSENNHNITYKLRQFLKTVDLLIYDLKLEIHQKKKFKIYFDAADVINAIEGIPIFYDYDFDEPKPKLNFNKDIFDSSRTLVNSLTASGILGKIHLLLPHQGELVSRVKSLMDFGTNLKVLPDELAEKFLEDTGFKEIEWEKFASATNPNEKAEEIIKQIPSHKAKSLFKAVQCLQPWHSRLLDMINSGILESYNARNHYSPAGMFELIYELKEILDKKRPNFHRNNITDSLAIGALIEKVNNYKSEKSNELPCFFVSKFNFWQRNGQSRIIKKPSTFNQIVNSPEFSSYFLLDENSNISAIRDDEYFIFRATFINKNNNEESLNRLYEWHAEIGELLTTPSLSEIDKKLEDIKSKNEDLKSWAHLIAERENDSFFNEIWLPSEAPNKFSKAVKEIVEASERVKQLQVVKVSADEQLRRVVKDWEHQTAVFKNIRSMWEKLGARIKKWRRTEIFDKGSSEEIEQEIFKEFGFFRYSFPQDIKKTITSHIHELLKGKDSEKEARKRFLFAYVSTLESEILDKRALAIVISSLLVMENTTILKEVLKKYVYSASIHKVHYSFRIIYAKSLLDLDRYRPIKRNTCTNVKELINSLLDEINVETDYYEKAKIFRGIGYLYYWLWIGKNGESAWRKPPFKYKKDMELEGYIDKAVDYAKKSYFELEKIERDKLTDTERRQIEIETTYALNMYLYHLVEDNRMSGSIKQESFKVGQLLEKYRNNDIVWQYRYNDTIAVYYAKMAIMENHPQKRKEYIEMAEKRVKRAIQHIKKVYGKEALDGKDRDVKEHLEEIGILKLRIYNPK